jgi:hypothetical protein
VPCKLLKREGLLLNGGYGGYGVTVKNRGASSFASSCLGRVKFPSKPSIPFRVLSVFPTTWGIYSSLDGQPQWAVSPESGVKNSSGLYLGPC